MIRVDRPEPGRYVVSPLEPKLEGLVIHGYGGNKEEVLGLTIGLAGALDARMLVFDLPGHGDLADRAFTADSALAALRDAVAALGRPAFFVGHSAGARLGFMSGLAVGVGVSMPGPAEFEGNSRELLQVLRARRVTEASAFSGLSELLALHVRPASATLLLRAAQEIRSVNVLADEWAHQGIECRRIDASNHLDIVSSPHTYQVIHEWLTTKLP